MTELPEIHKFGGSCLRDASDVERIAEILELAQKPVIVVVSALWGTTDRLMRAAQEPRYAGRLVNDLASHHLRFSPTLIDSSLYDVFQKVLEGIEDSLTALATDRNDRSAYNRLLASGERLSALVIAHALSIRGLPAHPVGAEDIGVHLDGAGRASRVDLDKSRKPCSTAAPSMAYRLSRVVWGRNGRRHRPVGTRGERSHRNRPRRSASGSQVTLWKDVSGIYPVNPRWGVQSTPIPYLGYGEAIAFSNADATILHPATVEPVYEMGIPIEIRHLAHHKKGAMKTIIGPDIEATPNIKGIACTPRAAYVNAEVRYSQDAARALSDLLQELDEEGIRICSLKPRTPSGASCSCSTN